MRASLVAVALLALAVSPALATLGDNGMTTYTGRKREANTLVFGNEYLVNQAMAATMEFTRDVLKGTWKPTRNQPATEKQEVRAVVLVAVAAGQHAGSTAAAACAGSGLLVAAAAAHTLRPAASPDPSTPCCSLLPSLALTRTTPADHRSRSSASTASLPLP
jgi:hypothetical protein